MGRTTEGKRITKKLKLLGERVRALRVKGGKAMMTYVHQHLQGHIRYYGVSGNLTSVRTYYYFATERIPPNGFSFACGQLGLRNTESPLMQ